MWACCELSVSFPWVCNSHIELTANTAWWAHQDVLTNSSQQAHPVSCKLTARSPFEFQTHGKLTASLQCKSSCEFTVRQLSVLKMSFLWVSMCAQILHWTWGDIGCSSTIYHTAHPLVYHSDVNGSHELDNIMAYCHFPISLEIIPKSANLRMLFHQLLSPNAIRCKSGVKQS